MISLRYAAANIVGVASVPVDLALTKIKKLIVHEIPRNQAGGGSGAPVLSDVESPLDKDVQAFFENRLRHTLATAFPVEFLPSNPTTMSLTTAHLDGHTPFVTYSKKLAQHLFSIQTGVNSPGLLCVAACKNDGTHCIAMLKLEKEEGLRVKARAVDGLKTLSVAHVRDLMLTNRTRVFKAALIAPAANGLIAWACDEQRPGAESVASFFLLNFLGAKLIDKPDVLTRHFMDAVEGWIKADVPDAETKSRYQVALMAEMNSNKAAVSPASFAQDNLDPQDVAGLLGHLAKVSAPVKRFPKHVGLIRNRLRRIQFDLEGQIAVICPPEAVGDAVKVSEDSGDGEAIVWAKGRLQGVRGKGR